MQMHHDNEANEQSSNQPNLSYLRFVYLLTCAASRMETLVRSLVVRQEEATPWRGWSEIAAIGDFHPSVAQVRKPPCSTVAAHYF